ncbi:endonuclease domain-containing protein [Microbacterium sp. E-13]|uniref:endonuclease domain-containing protein n=1 Tax=Microbacterium sp. E-13 TaxID=3404048 RepID=UPI003CF47A2E
MPAVSRAASRQVELVAWVRKRHGVAHSSDIRAAGYTVHDIAGAVSAGLLSRVRRSWLVTPECDSRRLAAARVGGRATCVSAAAIQGFWLPDSAVDQQTHVAVPGTASRINSEAVRIHWGNGPAPTGRNQTEEPILNVLFHVARCLPRRDALCVWESAVRKKAVAADVLARVAWRSGEATALAGVASALSDSGLESIFVDALRETGVSVTQQVWIDGHPVDGLIGSSLVAQLDGFAHHSGAADRRRDLEADARLVMRGYVVLRFDYYQVLFQWDQVREAILTAIAQGAHKRPVLALR